jgi:NAD(P)-dependent dehydrogenase (short-subunit alcohol dehydrogenase family)
MKRARDLTGWVGVLTGAGSGIGRATALALGRRGMDVVVTDIDADRVAAVAAEVADLGRRSIGERCDVARLEDLERVRDRAMEEFGRIDLVMNNVGVLAAGLPEDIPVEEWVRMIDINLMGVVRSNAVFLPILLAQGHGHLVNTASTAGLYPYTYDRLPYTATKYAVVGMTEALALYLRPKGIGVTLLCPGPVATNIAEQIRYFGPPRPPRPPKLGFATAEAAGEQVADAVATDRFLVLTSPEAAEFVRHRGDDVDGFLEAQIADLQSNGE